MNEAAVTGTGGRPESAGTGGRGAGQTGGVHLTAQDVRMLLG